MNLDPRDIAIIATTKLFKGVELTALAKALTEVGLRIQEFDEGRVVLLAGCAYDDLRIIVEGEAAALFAQPADSSGTPVK